jgi:hypothetical protein
VKQNHKSEIINHKFPSTIDYGLWTIFNWQLIKPTVCCLMFIVSFFSASAQFTLKAALDTNHYLIGDHIKLQLAVTYDSSYKAKFPELPAQIPLDSILTLEVLDTVFSDSTLSGKIIKHNKTYFLSAYDSGNYFIPSVSVLFFNKKTNTADSLLSDLLFFRVETIEVDTSQAIKPIKEPLDLPFIFAEIKNIVIIAAIVLLLLAVAVYYFLTRKKKEIVQEVVVPKRPSHEITFEKLNALKEQKLWQKGEVKAYHSALSEIIREYLESRFQIMALEATTEEIVAKMKIFSIQKEQKIVLQEMLELADLVKFAKVTPLPDEHQRSFDIAWNFVQATKYENGS